MPITDNKPLQFFIAGVQYNPMFAVYQPLAKDGDTLKLIGEPKNKYDRYAVRIESPYGHILGHVPKPMNVDVWAQRAAGWKPVATLVHYNAAAPLWNMFEVRIEFISQQDDTLAEQE